MISGWTAGYARTVDLSAMKAAPGPGLAACAVAAPRNAQGLLHDAELLAGAGCTARAYDPPRSADTRTYGTQRRLMVVQNYSRGARPG